MIWTSSAQGKIRKKSEGIFYSTQRFSSWLWPLLWYTVKSGLLCIKTDPWRHEIHLPSSDGSVTSDRSDWHLKWPVKFKIKPVPPPMEFLVIMIKWVFWEKCCYHILKCLRDFWIWAMCFISLECPLSIFTQKPLPTEIINA